MKFSADFRVHSVSTSSRLWLSVHLVVTLRSDAMLLLVPVLCRSYLGLATSAGIFSAFAHTSQSPKSYSSVEWVNYGPNPYLPIQKDEHSMNHVL